LPISQVTRAWDYDVAQNRQSAFPLLLDTASAAVVVDVSTGVIRGWVGNGLPFVRAGRGGKKMFSRHDLEKWIERIKESAQP
jgi:hypothetical protein